MNILEGLRYCPFAVNLDRFVGSCNNHNNLSNNVLYQIKQKI